jgi:hypothetical protein
MSGKADQPYPDWKQPSSGRRIHWFLSEHRAACGLRAGRNTLLPVSSAPPYLPSCARCLRSNDVAVAKAMVSIVFSPDDEGKP